MSYIPQIWIDGPDGGTPINSARLTFIENGVKAATDLATSVVGPSGTINGAQPAISTATLQTGNYTASPNQIIPTSAVGGSFTVTLPTGAVMGTIIAVKLINTSGSNTVTVQSSGGDSINSTGTTTAVLQLVGESFEFVASGTGVWYLYGGQKALSSLDTRYLGASGTPQFFSQYLRVGLHQYAFTPVGGGSAYVIVDKTGSGNDASILFRDTGVIFGEVGTAADNDMHLKVVQSGTSFVDAIILKNATGYVYVPLRLGIGTSSPGNSLHVAAPQSAARAGIKVENTASGAGNSNSALVELKGNSPVANVDWLFGTDFGINGNNNWFVQDSNNGLRLFIDGSGRTVIGDSSTTTTATSSLDVVGSIKTRGVSPAGALNLAGRTSTAGAPASGTWAVGDATVDSNGVWWTCTGAGTPGTWVTGPPSFNGGTASTAPARAFQVRRDTLANWLANSTVVLAAGEIGYETDTGSWKVGDGSTTWAALAYPNQPSLWTPEVSGLIASTGDGANMPSQGPLTSGRPMFYPVRIKRNVAIANLVTAFVNGSTPPASNSSTYMAIYACAGGPGSSGGALLGATAELSGLINGASGNQALLIEPISGGAITAQSIGAWVYLMLLNTNAGLGNPNIAQWIGTRLYGTNLSMGSSGPTVTGAIPRVYTNSGGSTMTTPPSTVPALAASNSNIITWVSASQ